MKPKYIYIHTYIITVTFITWKCTFWNHWFLHTYSYLFIIYLKFTMRSLTLKLLHFYLVTYTIYIICEYTLDNYFLKSPSPQLVLFLKVKTNVIKITGNHEFRRSVMGTVYFIFQNRQYFSHHSFHQLSLMTKLMVINPLLLLGIQSVQTWVWNINIFHWISWET